MTLACHRDASMKLILVIRLFWGFDGQMAAARKEIRIRTRTHESILNLPDEHEHRIQLCPARKCRRRGLCQDLRKPTDATTPIACPRQGIGMHTYKVTF